ncbi:hypothetical protein BH24ACT26_BH24ACT26_05030 [soil metagenome]
MMTGAPDPAAIRLEVLSRILAGREGWARTEGGWAFGAYELIPRVAPGLSYELWRGARCVAAMMVPKDAIAVSECLAAADALRASTPQRLFDSLEIPLPP